MLITIHLIITSDYTEIHDNLKLGTYLSLIILAFAFLFINYAICLIFTENL